MGRKRISLVIRFVVKTTHKYDEATEAGIENMWSGYLKLDNGRQVVVCGNRVA
jgi:hypothetical protein